MRLAPRSSPRSSLRSSARSSLPSARLRGPLVLLAAALAFAHPAGADKPKLSDVVKQAAKPPAEQQPVGGAAPSESKAKAPEALEEPETSGPPAAPPPAPPVYSEVILYPGAIGAAALPPAELLGYSSGRVLPVPPAPGEPGAFELRAGITGGGGGGGARHIESYGGGGLLVGVGGGRWTADIRAQRTAARLSEEISPAMHSFRAWSGDLALRYRLTPPAARVGASLALTGRLGRYGWKYANAVTVAESWGERVVGRDTLPYRAILGGLGLEAARSDDWSLWITASAGVQQFADDTGAGFANDLFEDRAVFEITADLVRTLHVPASETAYERPRR